MDTLLIALSDNYTLSVLRSYWMDTHSTDCCHAWIRLGLAEVSAYATICSTVSKRPRLSLCW